MIDLLQALYDKPAQNKERIMILLQTQPQGEYTLNHLSLLLKLSIPTLRTLCREIQRDFEEMHYPLFFDEARVYWYPETFHANDYLRYLAKTSVVYQWLLASITPEAQSIDQFCLDNGLSYSTLFRKMKPCNTVLKKHGIEMNLSKMCLTAPSEEAVRTIYLGYLWFVSQGDDLFQVFPDLAREEELLEKLRFASYNHINQKLALLRLIITRIRIEQGFKVVDRRLLQPEPAEIVEVLNEYFRPHLKDPELCAIQAFSLYLQWYEAVLFINAQDARYETALTELRRRVAVGYPIAQATESLCEFLQEAVFEEQLSEADHDFLFLNCSIVLLDASYPQLVHSLLLQTIRNPMGDTLPNETRLFDLIKGWLQQHHELQLQFERDELANILTQIVCPIYRKTHHLTPLTVGVINVPNYFIHQDILHFLKQLSFVEYTVVSKGSADCDFYITPSVELIGDKTSNYFVIPYDGDEHYKEKLFEKLWRRNNAKSGTASFRS